MGKNCIMISLIKHPQVIVAFIALAGILISVFLSLFTSRKQLRIELEKHEKTLKTEFDKKLIDKRLNSYQDLWELLSYLNKGVLSSKFKNKELKEHIEHILSEIEDWYEKNGLLFFKK